MRGVRLLGLLVLQATLMVCLDAPASAQSKDSTPEHNLEKDATEITLESDRDNDFDVNDKSCVIIDGYSTETFATCYENAEKSIPIMFRKEWDGELGSIESSSPAEYVIIKDGGKSCLTTKDCLAKVQLEKKRTRKKACELQENFYVGSDGNVYEGRGWSITPYWHLNGLRNKSITVHFMGVYKNSTPSDKVIEDFETLMEIGLWLGKLSENYKIISMRHILNDSTLLGDALDRELMGWKRWWNETWFHSLWDYRVPSRLNFVLRRHWNASFPLQTFNRIQHPIEYVIIWTGGDRCTSRVECISQIKTEQVGNITQYGDLLDNFYIGDANEIYEGRGWDVAPHWHVKGFENKYISVRLQGSFEYDFPTEKAMNALKGLVETGVWLGKISPTFKMFSLRQVYNDSSLLGEELHQVLEKWTPWMKIGSKPASGLALSGFLPFVTRRDWNASSANKSQEFFEDTIQYVMVGDGGGRCYTRESCILSVQNEQRNYNHSYGDLLDNFYIGDDGNVYEGRGWNQLPHFYTTYFRRSSISVKFMGSFQTTKPSWLALQAFDALIKFGLRDGRIAPNYKIFSSRQIYNDSAFMSDGLASYMEAQTHWATDLTLFPEDALPSSGLLPVISRAEWKAIGTLNDPRNLTFVNVVVNDLRQRCFTLKDCTFEIVSQQRDSMQMFGDVPDNFYVGDDGRVYEGLGWHSLPYNQPKAIKSSLFIVFFGRSENNLPSPLALFAFHRLMKFGTRTGKLADDYKIFSASELFGDNAITGLMFSENVKTWDRWSDQVHFSNMGPLPSSEESIFVPLTHWNTKTIPRTLSHPVELIVILDGGTRCYSQSECNSTLQRYLHPKSEVQENFYIGEDGRIYEGRGWYSKHTNASYISGLSNEVITVSFLGEFQLELPSANAISAFDYLVKWGIVSGKLKPNYMLKAFQDIYPNINNPGGVLSLNIKTWKNWSERKASIPQIMPVLPTQWGNSKLIRRSNRLHHPLKYIYLRDGGEQCFNYTECVNSIKKMETNNSNGILENFYIGGGCVFEGVGWFYDTYWGFSDWRSSISVQFLGSFETNLPSLYSITAFDMLINKGLKLNYILSDYKIRIIPPTYQSRIWAGRKLTDTVKTWKRWQDL